MQKLPGRSRNQRGYGS